MTPADVTLDELRRQIDDIDQRLHDLIMRRAELAASVARSKGGDPLWRPAREAAVLRGLAQRHKGAFPFRAVVRIWRELITAMTTLQGSFSVAVFVPPTDAGFWDLARDHYGTIAAIHACDSPGAVMRAVTESPNVVGMLPWPREDDADPWWRYILSTDEKAPRVVAAIPALHQGRGQPLALALARSQPEPSGDDRSLVAVETLVETSRARLLTRLAAGGAKIGFIATYAEAPSEARRLHLIDVEGFAGPELLDAIRAQGGEEFGRIVRLGAYPVPLIQS